MQLLHLAAGPLTMVFDPALAFLRHIRFGEREIVRGVYAAVRDQDWNTIPFTVHDLELERSEARFALSFLAKCAQGEIQFPWRGEITGQESGIVRFRFSGQAGSTFLKNRIGFCVLHPIDECAGQPCRVEHTDGSVTDGEFPKWISPHQPFKNIRSIVHPVQPDVEACVTFQGEAFEMEDQRNWTDASFKTYCTPLDLPFPVEIAAGTRVEQQVTIELRRAQSVGRSGFPTASPSKEEARVCIDRQSSRRLPAIGFSMATIPAAASAAVVERLRELAPDHLRVDLRLDADSWMERLRQAVELADRVGAKLELAVFTRDTVGPAWRRCLDQLRDQRDRIARWLVLHPTAKATPPALATEAYEALRQFDASIPVVVGTNAFFAELNRNRPPLRDQALVCYSITPQVHAFDNLSLRETPAAQRCTVDSAQQLFAAPVVVSPITLRPRFNPNATSSTAGSDVDVEPETDARQATGLAAAWTVSTLSQLASHRGVASLTFYETFGPRGIMDASGTVYPMFSVFQSLRDDQAIADTTTSRPLDVSAIALLRAGGRLGLLLGNMSSETQTVAVEVDSEPKGRVTVEPESVRVVGDKELR